MSADIEWRDSAGTLVPLTGWAPELEILPRPGAATPVLVCNAGNGRLTVVEGRMQLLIAAAVATALPAGMAVYRLRLTGASAVIGLLAGDWQTVRSGEGYDHAPPGPVVVRGDTHIAVVSHGVLSPGGGGVTAHADLTGRSSADSHPVSAITGLQAQLTQIAADIAACATAAALAAQVTALANVTSDLATHVASVAAHLPAGTNGRALRYTGGVPNWGARSLDHASPATDGDWAAARFDVRDNPVANSGGGQVAYEFTYMDGATPRSIALGGAQNGVGQRPLAATIPLPVVGSPADRYRLTGLLLGMSPGAVGLAYDCVIYPRTQVWAQSGQVLILGWELVNPQATAGGAGWYCMGEMTTDFSAVATSGWVGLGFKRSTREIWLLWSDGVISKYAPI